MKNTYMSIHGHFSLLKPIPIDFSPSKTPIYMFILSKTKTRFFAIFRDFLPKKGTSKLSLRM